MTFLYAVIIKDFSNSVEVKILPSKGRLSRGRQHVARFVVWAALLSAVALKASYFTLLSSISKTYRLSPTIVRFVTRTEPKASYRTVQ